MLKKNMIAIALIVVVIFVTSLTSFALETNNYDKMQSEELFDYSSSFGISKNTGDLLDSIKSASEQIAGLSEERKQVALEKLNDMRNTNKMIPYSTTWKYLSGFIMYKQSTEVYCVVASCKAAMQYLTSSSDSQVAIAADLGTGVTGTNFFNAQIYLNTHQSKNTYVCQPYDTAKLSMSCDFYSVINTYDAPPLISVETSISYGWPYSISAHTECISGARSDLAYFRIADPYIQWLDPNASMFYTVSIDAIHTGIVNRGNGYIY